MTTRTVNISLLEQTPQIRTLRFIPDLTSVDGDVLIQRRYKAVTDDDGVATIALPVKASGSIRYEYEIPRDGGKSTGEFYLSAGAAIDLDDLIALGGEATDTIQEYIDEQIDEQIAEHAAVKASAGALGHVRVDGTSIQINGSGIISSHLSGESAPGLGANLDLNGFDLIGSLDNTQTVIDGGLL